MIRALLVGAAALLLSCLGCEGCRGRPDREPAKPEQVALVEQALSSDAGYARAAAELEKDPREALRALRQTGAPQGSRRALLLRVLEARLENIGAWRDWRKEVDSAASPRETQLGRGFPQGVPGLRSARHAPFWAESLLVIGMPLEKALAARQLGVVGGELAEAALAIAAADVDRPGLPARIAAEVLGRTGRGRPLAEALAAWAAPGVDPSLRVTSESSISSALHLLPEPDQRGLAAQLVEALRGTELSAEQRVGYLRALRETAGPEHAPALAELRGLPWALPLRAEVDATISAALARPGPKGKR